MFEARRFRAGEVAHTKTAVVQDWEARAESALADANRIKARAESQARHLMEAARPFRAKRPLVPPELAQWLSDIKLLDCKNFVELLQQSVDTPDAVCSLSTTQLAALRRELAPGRTTRFDSALAVLAAARSGEEPSPSLGAAAPLEATARPMEAAALPPGLKHWAKIHRLERRPEFAERLCAAATEPQDLLDLTGERPDATPSLLSPTNARPIRPPHTQTCSSSICAAGWICRQRTGSTPRWTV
jgi:hypothetical protein